MNQDLVRRLQKLEQRYAAELGPQVSSIRWLTADEIKHGRLPGVYEVPREDGDSPLAPPSSAPSGTP